MNTSSISSVWNTTLNTVQRTVNTLDMATAMMERSVSYADEANKDWYESAKEERTHRAAERLKLLRKNKPATAK